MLRLSSAWPAFRDKVGAIIFGLSLIGVEKTVAAPYALVYHMMGIVPITIVGFIFLFMMGINLKDATSQKE